MTVTAQMQPAPLDERLAFAAATDAGQQRHAATLRPPAS